VEKSLLPKKLNIIIITLDSQTGKQNRKAKRLGKARGGISV